MIKKIMLSLILALSFCGVSAQGSSVNSLLAPVAINNLLAANSSGYTKLEPTLRETANDQLAPLSTKVLGNLLLHPTLMEQKVFESLAMVVAGEEAGTLLYASGDSVYVKGLTLEAGSPVALYSKFRQLIDPDSKENLGYEVRYLGEGIVNQSGPLSNVLLTATTAQVAPLDRVLSKPDQALPLIVPHKSAQIISGKIIALYDALTSTAEASSVVINRGSRDGVDIGQIYDATTTRRIIDPASNSDKAQYLLLPPEVIGEILIYKVYEKVSFGLVTNSSRPLANNSVVQSQQ